MSYTSLPKGLSKVFLLRYFDDGYEMQQGFGLSLPCTCPHRSRYNLSRREREWQRGRETHCHRSCDDSMMESMKRCRVQSHCLYVMYQCQNRPDESCLWIQCGLLLSDPRSQCEVSLRLHSHLLHTFRSQYFKTINHQSKLVSHILLSHFPRI